MPGKRKRGQETPTSAQTPNSTNAVQKPISAIAAARLKAEAAAQGLTIVEEVQDAPASPLAESSDSYCEESENDEVVPFVPKIFKLCTWRNLGSNVLSDTDDEFSIVLDRHVTIAFVGCFDVQVLKGAVNINGANLGVVPRQSKNSRVNRVFVPSTHPITKVRGLDHINHVQFSSCKEPTPFSGISPLFADIWAAKKSKGRSFDFIPESDADPLKRPLVPENTPEDWHRAIEDIASTPSITTVLGPSLVGKSIFAKRLLNRYLTGFGKSAKALSSVCLLDLDPRKPEYTTHGQISLTIVRQVNLGPSFTHPATPASSEGMNETVNAHALPVDSLSDYETYFNSCVEDLLRTYQNIDEDSTPPLIINVPATLYATHFSLLCSLLTTSKPNHIVHLGDTSSIDEDSAAKLHTLQTISSKNGSTFHELAAQSPLLPVPRTYAESRAMQIQAYFHCISHKTSTAPSEKQHRTPQHTWDPQPLSTMTPWEFCYEETSARAQDLIGFLPLFEPLPASQLCTALNGSVIHIVETSDANTQAQLSDLPRTPTYRIPCFASNPSTGMTDPLDPGTSRLICTVLIRGFDPENRIVEVLVPKSQESLLRTLTPEKTVFVAGCCDTPEWAYIEDAYHQLNDSKENSMNGGMSVDHHARIGNVEIPPWVERKNVVDRLGYLKTVRRVRKFLG